MWLYETLVILMMMWELLVSDWGLLGVFTLHWEIRIGIDLVFFPHFIAYESYKVMSDGCSCVNIISKIAVEKIDLKV